jgi:DUF2934 family protein
MQLKKPSKKTSKVAPEATVPAPEEVVSASPKSRSPRSSKKKSELSEMASVNHHHKAAPQPVTESLATQPIKDTPSRTVYHHQIAELAYAYWVERGFKHGSHEEDWLRAEKALGLR